MWFTYVLVGLAGLVVGGLYVRRRLATSLRVLGVRPRIVRVVRWVSAWLLFAFPLLIIIGILVAVLSDSATMPRFEGKLAAWLLGVPFLWALLVMGQSLPWLLVLELVALGVRRVRGAAIATRWRSIAMLGVLAAFAVYTPARVAWERGDVRVRHWQVAAPGAAAGGTPFRIAFVADVQQDAHTDAAEAREVVQLVNASAPDIVLSGGDWINSGPEYIAAAAESAGLLKSRLGTFTVRGDHEHFAYFDRDRSVGEVAQAMQAREVAMLNNEVRWFTHGDKRIAVLFLNYNYVFRTPAASVAALVASMAAADYSIVVTHQFDAPLAALVQDKVNLVLGAHTHGGQVNPVVGLFHVKLARLETTHVDGRYALGSTTVIVTSGVGYSLVPIRYASPGSLELIELTL